MLKFFFLLLLLANGGLFIYHQGYFAPRVTEKREPELNIDKIKLLPASAAAKVASAPGAPAAVPATETADVAAKVSAAPEAPVCLEIGNFAEADAKRFEARLAPLGLGSRLSRRDIQTVSSHMVLIPPQGSKELAEKKAGELRRLGVADFFVIQDNSDLRWAISLGIFGSEDAAKTRLAALNKQGVRSARIAPRNGAPKVAFQLRDLEAATKEKLDQFKSEFAGVEEKACSNHVAFN